MPGFRSRGRNMRYRRRRGGKGKYIAKIAKSVAQKVINSNLEWKQQIYPYNAVGTALVVGGTSTFASITYGSGTQISGLGAGIAQGTTGNTRIGTEIMLKSVQVSFMVQNIDDYNNLRFALIRPKGRFTTSSVAALAQAIFSTFSSASDQWGAPIDTDAYKIYWDRKFTCSTYAANGTGAAGVVQNKLVTKVLKFPGRGLKIQWDVGNNLPNRDLWLIASSDSQVVSHPGAIAGYVKLVYTDA